MAHSTAHRLIGISVAWTLALLWLGSVVHATESSLACPDWPTCFGTMFPVMEGGVFWEHSHRLVAGGLVLLWIGTTIALVRNGLAPAWVTRAAKWGIVLLLVQAVFGGMTVLFLLPAWISSTHLILAYLFLGLAVALFAATGSRWETAPGLPPSARSALHRGAVLGAGLVLLQSAVGAVVRHTDAGMACGRELLTCRGTVVPTALDPATLLHFGHRLLGIAVAAWIITLAVRATGSSATPHIRTLLRWAAAFVLVQIGLGYLSVSEYLGVAPVSLHTVGAALTFVTMVAAAAHTRRRDPADPVGRSAGMDAPGTITPT